MNTDRNEIFRSVNFRHWTTIACLLLIGGCERTGTRTSAGTPPTFPNPEILQFRILASPDRDATVCERAKALQARETTLGRPWSAEVYRDQDAKQDLSARWYRCESEVARFANGSTDMLLRQLPVPTGSDPQYEVLVLEDNFNINRVDFESIRTGLDDSGAPCVLFSMTKSGATKLFTLTSRRLPTPDGKFSCMAIVFDDKVVSAPRLNEAISSHGQITGNFTVDEVKRLVDLCNITHIAKPRPMPRPGAGPIGTGFATPTPTRAMPPPIPVGTGAFRPVPVVPPKPIGTSAGTATPSTRPSATPTSTGVKRP